MFDIIFCIGQKWVQMSGDTTGSTRVKPVTAGHRIVFPGHEILATDVVKNETGTALVPVPAELVGTLKEKGAMIYRRRVWVKNKNKKTERKHGYKATIGKWEE